MGCQWELNYGRVPQPCVLRGRRCPPLVIFSFYHKVTYTLKKRELIKMLNIVFPMCATFTRLSAWQWSAQCDLLPYLLLPISELNRVTVIVFCQLAHGLILDIIQYSSIVVITFVFPFQLLSGIFFVNCPTQQLKEANLDNINTNNTICIWTIQHHISTSLWIQNSSNWTFDHW